MIAKWVSGSSSQRLSFMGVETLIHVSSTDTAGAMSLIEVAAGEGSGIPPHVHSREDEVFHVLEGVVAFTLGAERIEAVAGATILGARNVPHSFHVARGPARILVFIQPGGVERMFVELASLPAGPPDMVRIGEICGRYGITFV